MNTNSVYVNHSFACNAEALFDWLTTPELLTQWFGPKGYSVGKVENELVQGGSYSIELNNESISFTIKGKYTQIVKPKELNFTYNYVGLVTPPPPSVVRIILRELSEENTSLSLIQEFESPSHDMEKRTVAWNHMMTFLQKLVIQRS